jgi:hypothetical protein
MIKYSKNWFPNKMFLYPIKFNEYSIVADNNDSIAKISNEVSKDVTDEFGEHWTLVDYSLTFYFNVTELSINYVSLLKNLLKKQKIKLGGEYFLLSENCRVENRLLNQIVADRYKNNEHIELHEVLQNIEYDKNDFIVSTKKEDIDNFILFIEQDNKKGSNYKNPFGEWEVSAPEKIGYYKNDNHILGIYTGYIDEIALHLADRVAQELEFRKISDGLQSNNKNYHRTAKEVFVRFHNESNTWEKIRYKNYLPELKEIFKDRNVSIDYGNYFATFKITSKD